MVQQYCARQHKFQSRGRLLPTREYNDGAALPIIVLEFTNTEVTYNNRHQYEQAEHQGEYCTLTPAINVSTILAYKAIVTLAHASFAALPVPKTLCRS